MDSTHSLRLFDIFLRLSGRGNDATIFVQEIEQIVDERFEQEKKQFSSKSEVEMLKKDMDAMEMRMTSKIENAILKSESNLKSEINKLLIWIVATVLGAGAFILAIAKILFDK